MSGEPLAGTTSLSTPPRVDELEISVFGPGVGESLLIHIGNRDWICVDSAKYLGEPWALSYLKQLAIGSERIRLIVATHWHSDHVDGISEIVRQCPGVQFACSTALRMDEFKSLLARYVPLETERLRAPLAEIRSVFGLYSERRKMNRDHPAPKLAAAGMLLHRSEISGVEPVEIWSLSPSDEDVMNAKAEFAQLFVPPEQFSSGMTPIGQNSTSVVLILRIGGEAILLGSDLEQTIAPRTGWNAVIATGWPLRPVSAFKVPHHGSVGAFSADLWQHFILPHAVAVITPFTRSGLPRVQELEGLKALGRELYITALPREVSVSRGLEVDREMKAMTRNFRSYEVEGKDGIVRLRKTMNSRDRWSAELFGAARRL